MGRTLPSPWSKVASTIPIFGVSQFETQQRYYEAGNTLTVASPGGIAQGFWSCNGLYDPNITGTGHQPIAFDQMMLFFEQYIVTKAKISVTFVSSNLFSRVGIFLNPDTTNVTVTQLVENGLMVSSCIDANAANGGTAKRWTTLEYEVDIATYFGRPKGRSIANDPDLTGGIASNPAEQVYFGVCVWSLTGVDSPGVYYDVNIIYDVIYTEPKKLASS